MSIREEKSCLTCKHADVPLDKDVALCKLTGQHGSRADMESGCSKWESKEGTNESEKKITEEIKKLVKEALRHPHEPFGVAPFSEETRDAVQSVKEGLTAWLGNADDEDYVTLEKLINELKAISVGIQKSLK